MGLDFGLRFPLSEVGDWAGQYAYADDSTVEGIGATARDRGYFLRDEFLAVARWKSPRSRSRCERNDRASVERLTRAAFSASDERGRIETLIQLHGVHFPTASVLLHLAHRDRYPIIDFRALWSLGVEAQSSYSFAFWWAYTEACRSLAASADVTIRTLDRALWQYSKAHQPPCRTAASATVRSEASTRPLPTGPRRTDVAGQFRSDVYCRLLEAAIEGHTITYGALPGGRGHIGAYLYRIADYEKDHGRPPLTAIVVRKQTGLPGEGFLIAMDQVGYARPGEPESDLWHRALADVFAYWRPSGKTALEVDVPVFNPVGE